VEGGGVDFAGARRLTEEDPAAPCKTHHRRQRYSGQPVKAGGQARPKKEYGSDKFTAHHSRFQKKRPSR